FYMPDIMDMPLAEAAALLKKSGIDYEFAGEGGKVNYQLPAAGANVSTKTVVYFHTDG
ncbi:MAG: PASTA domain-containing protein, partial [Clostridia bacterium]|nr:PASTA domain-containing protein [Clostridia bacterium]